MVKDFTDGTSFKGMLLVINQSRGVTNNGEAYLNVTLQDKTGQIEGKKWKATEADVNTFEIGKVVYVEAEVYMYKTDLQMKIMNARQVELEVGELNEFLESAPVARNELVDKLMMYVNLITNKQIRMVIDDILRESLTSFSIYPAASKNHHEYVSGLIYHTVSMLEVAKGIAAIYPSIDTNYLYAGIIMHDIGKIEELSGPSIPKYTTRGKLVGHISIMSARVNEVCKKLKVDDEITNVLQHLILSHHGVKEYGSPIEPLTREAELIYLIDNIDSKMNMIDKALEEVNEGEFSSRVMALDGRMFYKTKKTK